MSLADSDRKDAVVIRSDDLGVANRGAVEISAGAGSFAVE